MEVTMRLNKRTALTGGAALMVAALLMTCSKTYVYKENAVPEPVALSQSLKNLFKQTKLVCFGRYALTVPKEAEVIWGEVSFPSKIYLFKGDQNAIKTLVAKDIAKLKFADDDADITYNDRGPIEGSWQMRYYESKAAK